MVSDSFVRFQRNLNKLMWINSPSSQTNNIVLTQKLSYLIWKPVTHINSVHISTLSIFNIHFNIIPLYISDWKTNKTSNYRISRRRQPKLLSIQVQIIFFTLKSQTAYYSETSGNFYYLRRQGISNTMCSFNVCPHRIVFSSNEYE